MVGFLDDAGGYGWTRDFWIAPSNPVDRSGGGVADMVIPAPARGDGLLRDLGFEHPLQNHWTVKKKIEPYSLIEGRSSSNISGESWRIQ
jgi:hypothetical protein